MSTDNSTSVIDKLFERANNDFRTNDIGKREIVRDLAKSLETTGMPKDQIATEIARHCNEWVTDRYVRKCLEAEYKQESKVRNKDRNVTEQSSIPTPELEKVEAPITTTQQDGQVLESSPPPPPPKSNKDDMLQGPGTKQPIRSEEDIEEIRYLREQLTAKRMQEVAARKDLVITIDLDKFEKYIRLAFLNSSKQLSVYLNERYEVIKVE